MKQKVLREEDPRLQFGEETKNPRLKAFPGILYTRVFLSSYLINFFTFTYSVFNRKAVFSYVSVTGKNRQAIPSPAHCDHHGREWSLGQGAGPGSFIWPFSWGGKCP